ncbi:MAG: hypothetical protein SVV03_00585 [Candidatus Nanohaloarchaea archaeon]|nr:hypothetical protein [Candidatus Nanohaloarchaea archaeon]
MPIPEFYTEPQTVLFPLLYLGAGYASLLIGSVIARKTDYFLTEITGTDKVILTFLIGAFSLINVFMLFGSPVSAITLENFFLFLFPIMLITIINSAVISLVLKAHSHYRSKSNITSLF